MPALPNNSFPKIEILTRDESAHGGTTLNIQYQFVDSLFGHLFIATTSRGICTLVFVETKSEGLAALRHIFPLARLEEISNARMTNALTHLSEASPKTTPLTFHIKGTPFQQQVWNALLHIPRGKLTTYGAIAAQIQRPTACRAVGTAIGANPVALLIPCHRVVQADGGLGNYHWGAERKRKILNWEEKKSTL